MGNLFEDAAVLTTTGATRVVIEGDTYTGIAYNPDVPGFNLQTTVYDVNTLVVAQNVGISFFSVDTSTSPTYCQTFIGDHISISGRAVSDYGGAGKTTGAGASLAFIGSTFTGNTAGRYGGAVYNSATASISGSTFDRNTAGQYGGAVYNYRTATIENSTLSGNTAGGDGGAVYNLRSRIHNY